MRLTARQEREIYARQREQSRRWSEQAERSKRSKRLLGKIKHETAGDNYEAMFKFGCAIADTIPTKRMREKLEDLITAHRRGYLRDKDIAQVIVALRGAGKRLEQYAKRFNPEQRCPHCGALKEQDLDLTPEETRSEGSRDLTVYATQRNN